MNATERLAIYKARRQQHCRARLEKGETLCPCCGCAMYFNGLEDWNSFACRFEAVHGGPPSKWPAVISRKIASLDHLIPRSRGGSDRHRNLFVMCARCNQDKGAKTPSEWIAHRELIGRPLPAAAVTRLLRRERKALTVKGTTI